MVLPKAGGMSAKWCPKMRAKMHNRCITVSKGTTILMFSQNRGCLQSGRWCKMVILFQCLSEYQLGFTQRQLPVGHSFPVMPLVLQTKAQRLNSRLKGRVPNLCANTVCEPCAFHHIGLVPFLPQFLFPSWTVHPGSQQHLSACHLASLF